ncbi:MAG: hypothetical protein DMG60_22400 [Acidobacteria bacterium]|nr:MAG: hypothetical protein DMG60_22400 [Acidobacteriota bacterium]
MLRATAAVASPRHVENCSAYHLHFFLHNKIDLIISDHILQDLPGAQLIDEMKRIKPNVPFLILSGLQASPDGAEHADLFLTKGMAPLNCLLPLANCSGRNSNAQAT